MLNKILYKKNNTKIINKFFATHNKPPNPNKQDFGGPFIILSLIYLGIDLFEKFSEYSKRKK